MNPIGDYGICPYCDDGVPRVLSEHLQRVHSGTRKRICPGCGQVFARVDNLHRHLKNNRCPAKSPTSYQQPVGVLPNDAVLPIHVPAADQAQGNA